MGSDDLFHKRKAKKANALQRRTAHRKVNKRVLIVCEGESEVSYFRDAREHFELNTVDVEITNKGSTDPANMVKFAKTRFTTAKNEGNPFDLVFCVFDKDNPTSYNSAVQHIDSAKPKDTFFVIGSVPCFEYWLLLHFTNSTSPFANAKAAETALKKHLPNYEKNQNGLFKALLPHLEKAKQNAATSLQTSHTNHTDNPSTRIHELIAELEKLKNSSA